jgi:hypothetical protein
VGARTIYLRGLIEPGALAAYIPPDNGFYSIAVAFRLSEIWRLNLRVTDFFGGDPYKSVGLYKDRDELNLTVSCLF